MTHPLVRVLRPELGLLPHKYPRAAVARQAASDLPPRLLKLIDLSFSVAQGPHEEGRAVLGLENARVHE